MSNMRAACIGLRLIFGIMSIGLTIILAIEVYRHLDEYGDLSGLMWQAGLCWSATVAFSALADILARLGRLERER